MDGGGGFVVGSLVEASPSASPLIFPLHDDVSGGLSNPLTLAFTEAMCK